ncbi:PREDICTED: uncharacterized protein LOC105366235 [Ceratosolen solmsi marchali]|uniref:Uncharacterized protein LOC105366235 n=1 Tax=Ceratosolen solmsi marchali TaxID=326594 RepID=A0AAJ7E090_9HYME|nr:PREDICTED: uncharacterized protein LOC105366235 [Ceratosolen solmsi marchali]
MKIVIVPLCRGPCLEDCYETFPSQTKKTVSTTLLYFPYAKEECAACCNQLPSSKRNKCNFSCVKKFAKIKPIRSFDSCLKNCKTIVPECRAGCNNACHDMFPKKHRSNVGIYTTPIVYGVWRDVQ